MQVMEPSRDDAQELRTTINLYDFLQVWWQYRLWFVIGLIMVTAVAWGGVKLKTPMSYRAQAKVFITRPYTPEMMAWMTDVEASKSVRYNEEYESLVQVTIAQNLYFSRELLTAAAQRLRETSQASVKPYDLYQIFCIANGDEAPGQAALAAALQGGLDFKPVQNTGVVICGVRLPKPEAAAPFLTLCIDELNRRMMQTNYGFVTAAVTLHEKQLEDAQRDCKALGEKLTAFAGNGTTSDSLQLQRMAIQNELKRKIKWMNDLTEQVDKLRLINDPIAQGANLPVRILEQASPPAGPALRSPALPAAMAACLYTMIFMVGIALIGYMRTQAEERTRRHP